MDKEPKPPFEETEESFGRWFRAAAKEKWENYLSGKEQDITIEDRDALRKFLLQYGTKEEMEAKLDSFGFNMLADEALREEIKSRRPDIKLDW
jgi:hypothetical protein